MIFMNTEELKKKYIKDLEENLLPFWEKAIDTRYGGIFTCFTNDGSIKISNQKYIWSQGRFLWLCSNLVQMKGCLHLSPNWEEALDTTYSFLKQNALAENHHAVYSLERDGTKLKSEMDKSIFADCFYVLGCGAYARYREDNKAFEQALFIYQMIVNRVKSSDFKSEPYPIPVGYRTHSLPMILLNVSQELYETAVSLKHESKNGLLEDMKKYVREIVELTNSNRIVEMSPYSFSSGELLIERHVNPGHTLESAWFMIHAFKHIQMEDISGYLRRIENVSYSTLELGWDKQYGGLFRFTDKEGGAPRGDKIHSPFESLITDTWDSKLWWPHAEALYTTLLLYHETKDNKWKKWYEIVSDYVFRTFPNPDSSIGEWIQIRDRKGHPLQKVVALPVKDPFHIIRSYIYIIKLLEGK